MRGLDYLPAFSPNYSPSGTAAVRTLTCLFRTENKLRNKLCGSGSPTLSNCASPVPHAVLSVPVLPDLKTKQSVPRNTAAKSPASTKRRKSNSTGRQNRALTSILLGVDPSKPPRQPNQRSARETARNISHCPHLPMLPHSPIVNPPPKSKSHQSTKHQGRLTLMGEMHSICGSKRCGIRIIAPRHRVIWTL